MVKRILVIMIILQMICIPISNAFSLDSVIGTGNQFLEEGKSNSGNLINNNQLKTSVGDLYNILLGIGIALSVIIGAVLGIKFMVGSVEEQAKIKETLIPYAISCIVVFGAFGIWKIVISIGGNIF